MGTNQIERVKKGIHTCIFMGISIVIAIGIPAYLFSDLCIRMFSQEADVIYYGSWMMRTLVPFYSILNIAQVLTGAVRGTGNTIVRCWSMCSITALSVRYFWQWRCCSSIQSSLFSGAIL